jgi:hypothetical protein
LLWLTAAELLSQSKDEEQRALVHKLLEDKDPHVRQRIGMVLAANQDKKAIPVLIDLLAELSPGEAVDTEEFLLRLAGDDAPGVQLGTDKAGRKKCRDAWVKWWDESGSKLDLAKATRSRFVFGQLLLVEPYNPTGHPGRVLELDAHGKLAWELGGFTNLIDALVLPRGTVVIADNNGFHLSERNLQGKVLWEKNLPQQVKSLRRMPGGKVGVVTASQALQLDSKGKETSTYTRPNNWGDVVHGNMFDDGSLGLVLNSNQWVRVDAKGNQKAGTPLPYQPVYYYFVSQLLPNNHLVVCSTTYNKLMEYDGASKVVWEVGGFQPNWAVKTARGTTLVASQWQMRLAEYNMAGKLVWESTGQYRPSRAHRR